LEEELQEVDQKNREFI